MIYLATCSVIRARTDSGKLLNTLLQTQRVSGYKYTWNY